MKIIFPAKNITSSYLSSTTTLSLSMFATFQQALPILPHHREGLLRNRLVICFALFRLSLEISIWDGNI